MKLLPDSLQALVAEMAKLPGVGERTALRYAVALLKGGSRRMEGLSRCLEEVQNEVQNCPNCHFWMQATQCPICSDAVRVPERLCVVRDSPDVMALEKFRKHPWKYHVLQGLLAPLSGVGPSQIRFESLLQRLENEPVKEIIFAVDATVEGDATCLFLRDQIRSRHPSIHMSRTAMGLPAGSSVEFLDASTLENALQHRTMFE